MKGTGQPPTLKLNLKALKNVLFECSLHQNSMFAAFLYKIYWGYSMFVAFFSRWFARGQKPLFWSSFLVIISEYWFQDTKVTFFWLQKLDTEYYEIKCKLAGPSFLVPGLARPSHLVPGLASPNHLVLRLTGPSHLVPRLTSLSHLVPRLTGPSHLDQVFNPSPGGWSGWFKK